MPYLFYTSMLGNMQSKAPSERKVTAKEFRKNANSRSRYGWGMKTRRIYINSDEQLFKSEMENVLWDMGMYISPINASLKKLFAHSYLSWIFTSI